MLTGFSEIEKIISAIRGRPQDINSFDAQSHFDHFAPVNDQAAYIIDFKRKQICEQKGVYDLLGYSAEEFQYKTLIGILHPDDRNLICHIVKTALVCANENGIDSNDRLFITFQIRKKSGEYILVERLSGPYVLSPSKGLISNFSILREIPFANARKFNVNGKVNSLVQRIFTPS